MFPATSILLTLLLGLLLTFSTSTSDKLLSPTRHSPSDLEVNGDLAGLPDGALRFVSYEDLLKLPQVEYTVSDDSNFAPGTLIGGVPLDALARGLGSAPAADLVVAICYDKYRANYPRSYVVDHRPLLVLRMNGKPPKDWPRDAGGGELGPYLISHPAFTPSFRVFSHVDEKQIPTGVTRIVFSSEKKVFGAIRPRGVHAGNSAVMQGYRIAQQNCYRCHNMGAEGGQKAHRPWSVLAAWAATDPEHFDSYVRNPQAVDPRNKMEGSPQYDDATLRALRAYFSTFSMGSTQ